MIEGKFYAKCLKESYANLEEISIPLGVGDKYLIRKLSQEYLAIGLSEDYKQESWIERNWGFLIKAGKATRETCIIHDIGTSNAESSFRYDYVKGFSVRE